MDSKDKSPATDRFSAFAQTHWTMVQRAASGEAGPRDEALEKLCETYWRPLYGYVRRRGYNVDDAQDLTQAFFARLLEKRFLAAVDRRKGKFRSFLLAALEHFLANEWRNGQAQKRGGGVTFISYEGMVDDGFEEKSEFKQADAERFFEREWALALLAKVLGRLESEVDANGRRAIYDETKNVLTGHESEVSYAQVAARHGVTEATVKMTVYRLRKRYGEILLEELANTVSNPEEIEEEMRALFAALS